MPTWPVTSGIAVMTSRTSRRWSVSNRMSRLVTIPSSIPESSTTGTPEMRYWPHSASASPIEASGPIVIGCATMPASDRLTRSTCWAWSSIDRLRCRTPRPPWRAMAIAIRASVTVSIALDSSGILTSMRLERRVVVSTSLGMTSDAPGNSRTSSKVRASGMERPGTSAGLVMIPPVANVSSC
jgi:hypothetical protein